MEDCQFKIGDIVYISNKNIMGYLQLSRYKFGEIIDVKMVGDTIMYGVKLYPEFGLVDKYNIPESWLLEHTEREEEIDAVDISEIL